MASSNESYRELGKRSCELRENGIELEKSEISISFEFTPHKTDFPSGVKKNYF
jgi:hypothetical protein